MSENTVMKKFSTTTDCLLWHLTQPNVLQVSDCFQNKSFKLHRWLNTSSEKFVIELFLKSKVISIGGPLSGIFISKISLGTRVRLSPERSIPQILGSVFLLCRTSIIKSGTLTFLSGAEFHKDGIRMAWLNISSKSQSLLCLLCDQRT